MNKSTTDRPFKPVGNTIQIKRGLPWESKRFRAGLLIASILFVIATLLRLLTPFSEQTVPVSVVNYRNVGGSKSEFNRVQYLGPSLDVPEQIRLAAPSDQPIAVGAVLGQKFELLPVSDTDNLWRGLEYSMSFSPETKTYTLVANDTTELETSSQGFGNKKYLELAESKLKDLFPNTQLVAQVDLTTFSDSLIHYDEVPAEEAVVASIPFAPEIDAIPIYTDAGFTHPVILDITSNGTITKIVVSEPLVSFQKTNRTKVLSLNQAIGQLNNQEAGTIITAFNTSSLNLSLDTIQSGALNQATFEYRYNSETGLVAPFYRLKGVIENESGQKYEAEIITPAVELQNL